MIPVSVAPENPTVRGERLSTAAFAQEQQRLNELARLLGDLTKEGNV
jgi:hypothetical protein